MLETPPESLLVNRYDLRYQFLSGALIHIDFPKIGKEVAILASYFPADPAEEGPMSVQAHSI